MDKHMYLWRGADRLSFAFGDKPNGVICKLVTVKDHIFAATTTNNLYHGEVSLHGGACPALVFKRAQFDVVDLASNSEHLFVVNTSGHVLKVNPQDMSVVDSIVLKEEEKRCSHGCREENEVVKVKFVAVSDQAALFVTDSGQLWASGNQPQIDISSTEPKKVKFFEGRTVSEIACGSNFNVAAVRKTTKFMKDDTDSENELEEEIFINSCPQCLNNVMLSPGSVTSSDTCLTGLHAQQFSEDRSTNSISALSTASKEHIFLPEIDKKEQPSDIVENGEECLNNLTDSDKDEKRNVIFINTETARQFLTRQLSWVSSYGSAKEDVPMESVDRSTRLIKQNVSNMANLVYEGVKNVGGKVISPINTWR